MFSTRLSPSAMEFEEAVSVPAPKFPTYLLPSLSVPFRKRRQSSQVTTASSRSSGERSLSYSSQDSAYTPSLCTSPADSTVSSPTESLPSPSYWWSKFPFSQGDHQTSAAKPDNQARQLSRAHPNTLRCSTCSTDIAFSSQIVSKGFTGRYGRAYLVSAPSDPPSKGRNAGDLINVKLGKPETRQLVTGSHIVADITCVVCHAKVGWKYVDAKDESQKYKVGKFILETQRVLDFRSWEDVVEVGEAEVDGMEEGFELESFERYGADDAAEPIVFDSEDEDECEDLFSGTWDPQVVAKRRARKVNIRGKQAA